MGLASKYVVSLEEKLTSNGHYKRWYVVRGLYAGRVSFVPIGRYRTRRDARAAIKTLEGRPARRSA